MTHTLYRIESGLREKKAGPVLRQAYRASQSKPIVERIKRACTRMLQSRRFLPKSAMSQAMEYTLGQMAGLEVYLEDGRVEIDNNLVENVTQSFGLHSLCRVADNAEKLLPKAQHPSSTCGARFRLSALSQTG